ncbi:MAG: hypothetical protein WCA89_00970 [Terracidiphilus sp.]|jgi:hypothetical protein
MEADWEFEVGPDASGLAAPVIEADWPGFVDLRHHPERIEEIQEVAAFPPLAALLEALNGNHSPLWTVKCDLWEPEADELAGPAAAGKAATLSGLIPRAALACYVDLLPLAGEVFAQAQQVEAFCREWVARLAPLQLPQCRVDLVIRQALAGQSEGFGITAYLSAWGQEISAAAEALAATLAAFADAIPAFAAPETRASKLQ